jgi:hypothetical protein
MEQPQEIINKKIKITEARNEIKGIKQNLFKDVAVMRGDDLRAYLDHLRYAENLIRAKDAQGKGQMTICKELPKHKEMKTEINTEESTEEEQVKKVEKKVKADIKEIKKEMNKEKKEIVTTKKDGKVKHVILNKKEHEKESSLLDKIPKDLHKLFKKHLKYHDGDEKLAHKAFKADLKKLK